MPSRVILEVMAGPIRGKRYVFEQHDTFIFGRANDCHARLPEEDATVSRHHFLLEVNPPDARVQDLGSRNGTYINGRKHGGRLKKESPEEAARRNRAAVDLRDGDKVEAGETTISVHIEIPVFCCRCRTEIPADLKSLCTWIEGAYICPPCNEQVKTTSGPVQRIPLQCEQCGKEVPDDSSGGRSGAVVCESCRSKANFDPVAAIAGVLLRQREEGQEEAALTRIAGYEIERMLGKGGMGAVYLARRKQDGSRVALKILLAKVAVEERARQLFHREVEVTRELHHSNIVELLDHGSAGCGFFFVMEFCEGGSAEELMHRRGGKLSLVEALPVLQQTLDGLAFAHQKGFVHRDLKPANILLTGNHPPVAKLADFGLAKNFERAGFSGMTATGIAGGTPVFMPREQLIQFRATNPVSDVYSLAAAFYYMVTASLNREFPEDKDPIEVILRGGSIPLRNRDAQIPKKLARIIDRALSDEPKDRFPSAVEFRKELSKAL